MDKAKEQAIKDLIENHREEYLVIVRKYRREIKLNGGIVK